MHGWVIGPMAFVDPLVGRFCFTVIDCSHNPFGINGILGGLPHL
jgi:hypothetical protein